MALDTSTDAVLDLTCIEDAAWAAIWRQRTGDRLRCRSCDQPVHAKRRTKTGMRFFAHSVVVPDCPTTGESARHLELKALFAAGFRAAGWPATFEASGDGWRADVLATRGDRRIAVEVQLSPIDPDVVTERTRRHQVSGVKTLWVTDTQKRPWSQVRPNVIVGDDSRVIGSVVIPAKVPDGRPVLAEPASIDRFVQRFVEGRLSAIPPTAGFGHADVGRDGRRLFQLDGCVDSHVERVLAEQARVEAARIAHAAEMSAKHEREIAEQERAESERLAVNELMEASLEAFIEWFEPERRAYGFTTKRFASAQLAAFSPWKHDYGLVIAVGWIEPTHILALAEPRRRPEGIDQRVLAWTIGADPATNTNGFTSTLTPASSLDEVPGYAQLKRFRPRRRYR